MDAVELLVATMVAATMVATMVDTTVATTVATKSSKICFVSTAEDPRKTTAEVIFVRRAAARN